MSEGGSQNQRQLVIRLRFEANRLAAAHPNARTLSEGTAQPPGISSDLSRVQTNLVDFHLTKLSGKHFEEECRKRGLLGEALDPQRVRFVTHNGISPADIQGALEICQEVMSA